MSRTPRDGARLLLERERDDGASAVYRVAIYAPDATYEGRATLVDDGAVELVIDAPAELADALRMLVKLTARAAASKRAAGLTPWPARVLRWRGPGRQSSSSS